MQDLVIYVKWTVAHYGIRKNETEFKFKVKWTNGDEDFFDVKNLNKTIIVRQSK